jgi:hypothetical protein
MAAEKPHDKQIGAVRLRNWLSNSALRWLVVFDGADDPPVLQDLIPTANTGRVLITSRSDSWPGLSIIHLVGLSDGASLDLLSAASGRSFTKDDVALVRAVGANPLALRQLGMLAGQNGWSTSQILSEVESTRIEILDYKPDPAARSVLEVIAATIDRATSNGRLGTFSRDLISVFSYFAPAAIPMSLLEEFTVWTSAGAKSPLDATMALTTLAAYSVANRHGETFSIHPLVQSVCRNQCEMTPTRTAKILELATQLVAALGVSHRESQYAHAVVLGEHGRRLGYRGLELLSLQIAMRHEAETFQVISNMLSSRHEMVKRSIANVR